MLWKRLTNAIVEKTLLFKKGSSIKVTSDAGVESTIDLAELAALDSIGATDLAKIDGITNGTAAASKALVLDANKAVGDIAQLNVLGAGAVATNQALGSTALDANTTGARNTAVGIGALSANTTGVDNTATGKDALLVATIGTGNTAIGSLAMDALTTGTNNTAVGLDSLGAVTTGINNTAVGKDALKAAVSTIANTAVGFSALAAATTGDRNVAVGTNALLITTIGSDNIAIGSDALNAMTTGVENVAIGTDALGACTIGTSNIAIGDDALLACTTGVNNVAVGRDAGVALTVGTGNLLLGTNAAGSAVGAVDQIVLSAGTGVTGVANGAITLGNNSRAITCNYDTDQTWDAPSDLRMKNVECRSTIGLNFITRLEPIEYYQKPASEWPAEWGVDKDAVVNTKDRILGLGAQDVKAAMDAAGVTCFRGWSVRDNGQQTLGESAFIYPLINAVKELAEKVAILERRLA